MPHRLNQLQICSVICGINFRAVSVSFPWLGALRSAANALLMTYSLLAAWYFLSAEPQCKEPSEWREGRTEWTWILMRRKPFGRLALAHLGFTPLFILSAKLELLVGDQLVIYVIKHCHGKKKIWNGTPYFLPLQVWQWQSNDPSHVSSWRLEAAAPTIWDESQTDSVLSWMQRSAKSRYVHMV